MSEIPLGINPLPRSGEYETGMRIYQQLMDEKGGAWEFSEYLNAQANNEEHVLSKAYRQSFEYGFVFEPFSPDFSDVDTSYRATHAFYVGIVAARGVSDIIYKGEEVHSFDALFETIDRRIEERDFEDSTNIEEQKGNLTRYMTTYAREGFVLLGKDARTKLHEWSESMYADIRHQRIFKIGYGAVTIAASTLHQKENERLIEELVTGFDWSGGVEDIIARNTGE